jgi:UDP-N-acetylmuramoyl-L-alanyl-D-glutamate--2,6-diaminopimelate ligase
MRLLKDILYKVRMEEVVGSTHIAVENIAMDSREVKPMSLFAAIVGYSTDGHQFITTAIEKGANCILCQQFPDHLQEEVTYIKVQDSSEVIGHHSG